MIRREDMEYDEAAQGTDVLTAEEMWRLSVLLRRYGDQPLYVELGLDIRRLEFARWLVQRGVLNEGLEHANADEAGDKCDATSPVSGPGARPIYETQSRLCGLAS